MRCWPDERTPPTDAPHAPQTTPANVPGALVAYGLAQSAARRLRERYDARARRLRDARAAMGRAVSYHEWRDLARTVDHLDENRLGGRCAVQEGERAQGSRVSVSCAGLGGWAAA